VFRVICKGADGKWEAKLLDGPVNLQGKLKKAEKDGLLKVGCIVLAMHKSNLDVGKESPMKVIELKIDPVVNPQALELLKKFAAAAPAAGTAKPKPAGDDLFGDGGGDDGIPF
jgi:hypothetical protein